MTDQEHENCILLMIMYVIELHGHEGMCYINGES